MSKKTIKDIEKLKKIISESFSIAQVLKKLDLVIAGGNYKTIKMMCKKHNISMEHFTGQRWITGRKFTCWKGRDLTDILVENSDYTSTYHLKEKLLKNNLLTYKCSKCEISTWQNKKLILQLDHINGINDDNRIVNLRLLCPNCHSQTETFSGKNKKNRSGGG